MLVALQVQILLRLYTTLLPNLRQAALQTAPPWAGGTAVEAEPGTNACHDTLAATIRREAAAVLNVGHVFLSEGTHHHQISLPHHLLQNAHGHIFYADPVPFTLGREWNMSAADTVFALHAQ